MTAQDIITRVKTETSKDGKEEPPVVIRNLALFVVNMQSVALQDAGVKLDEINIFGRGAARKTIGEELRRLEKVREEIEKIPI